MSQPKKCDCTVHRSVEVLQRQLQEHCDAYLLIGINPSGVPMIINRAGNPAYCIALNTILGNVAANGGVANEPGQNGKHEPD